MELCSCGFVELWYCVVDLYICAVVDLLSCEVVELLYYAVVALLSCVFV